MRSGGQMFRTVLQKCLKFVTMLSPVFLAACYGPINYPYDVYYPDVPDDKDSQEVKAPAHRKGVVVDSVNKTPVAGIRVLCLSTGGNASMGYTGANGRFDIVLGESETCTALAFDDMDGEQNGKYESKVVEWCGTCQELSVELTPVM